MRPVGENRSNRSGKSDGSAEASDPKHRDEPDQHQSGEGEKDQARPNAQAPLVEPEVDLQVEVFRTSNLLLAKMVIDNILAKEGLGAALHDRVMQAMPAPFAMPGEFGVAVSEIDREVALQALQEARRDGLLLDEGEILDGPVD